MSFRVLHHCFKCGKYRPNKKFIILTIFSSSGTDYVHSVIQPLSLLFTKCLCCPRLQLYSNSLSPPGASAASPLLSLSVNLPVLAASRRWNPLVSVLVWPLQGHSFQLPAACGRIPVCGWMFPVWKDRLSGLMGGGCFLPDFLRAPGQCASADWDSWLREWPPPFQSQNLSWDFDNSRCHSCSFPPQSHFFLFFI